IKIDPNEPNFGLHPDEVEAVTIEWLSEHAHDRNVKIASLPAFQRGVLKIRQMMRRLAGKMTGEDVFDRFQGATIAKRAAIQGYEQRLNFQRIEPQLSARIRTVPVELPEPFAAMERGAPGWTVDLMEMPMASQLRQLGENGVPALRWISRGGKYWAWNAG